jgi:hypothetical protein
MLVKNKMIKARDYMNKMVIALSALIFSQLAHASFTQMFCNGDKGFIISVDTEKKELKKKTKNLVDGTYSEESTYPLLSFGESSAEEYSEIDRIIFDVNSAETYTYQSSIKQKFIITSSPSSKTFMEDGLFTLNRWTNKYEKTGSSAECFKKVE